MTSSFITCLPLIICRYTTFLSNITKSSKKIYFNVCDLEKNGILHVKLIFETTLIFYMKAEAIFQFIFFTDHIKMHCLCWWHYHILQRIILMFAILTKTVFCLQFLLLERPPFSYMNGDPLFLFLFFADHMYIQNIS